MRSEKEIKEYLMLPDYLDNEYDFITPARDIEKKYGEQITNGTVGYGLYSDFANSPYMLENDETVKISQIEEMGGVVVYAITPVIPNINAA